jgi:hypothetical protein
MQAQADRTETRARRLSYQGIGRQLQRGEVCDTQATQ